MMTTYEDNVMVNQINDLTKGKLVSNTESQDKKPVTKPQESQARPANDRVDLSDAAKSFESIQRLIDNAPEVDAKKVEAVKNEIQKGTLDINSENIAKKILEELGA